MKIKSQNTSWKVFLIGNTVAYSVKQLFISAPQNYCTKSIGKLPQKIAHASFFQCSAYIVLGQDYDLGRINLKILCPHTFSLGKHNS